MGTRGRLQGLSLPLETVLKARQVFLEIRGPAIPQLNKNKLPVIIFKKICDYPGEQAEAYTYYGFRILTSSLGRWNTAALRAGAHSLPPFSQCTDAPSGTTGPWAASGGVGTREGQPWLGAPLWHPLVCWLGAPHWHALVCWLGAPALRPPCLLARGPRTDTP